MELTKKVTGLMAVFFRRGSREVALKKRSITGGYISIRGAPEKRLDQNEKN